MDEEELDDDPFLKEGNHKEKQPWWNDGDKVGGMSASILLLALAIAVSLIIIGLSVKFFIWITPGV